MPTHPVTTAQSADFYATVRKPVECGVCGTQALSSQCSRHDSLGVVCPTCSTAAGELEREYDKAEARQRAEFRAQLRSLVLQRRSGQPSPEFYRGEIA